MNTYIKLGVVAALFTLLTAISGSGCGGSDTSSDSGAPLAKAQFLVKSEQICSRRLKEKDALIKAAVEEEVASEGSRLSKHRQEEVEEEILALYRTIADELESLHIKSADRASAEQVLSTFKANLKRAESSLGRVAKTDFFQATRNSAEAFGFTCSL